MKLTAKDTLGIIVVATLLCLLCGVSYLRYAELKETRQLRASLAEAYVLIEEQAKEIAALKAAQLSRNELPPCEPAAPPPPKPKPRPRSKVIFEGSYWLSR